jgi:enoyl-CoA hydratase
MRTRPTLAPSVHWRTVDTGILVVTLDRGPANALAPENLAGLSAALQAAADEQIRVMVICSAIDGWFAAGADIKYIAGIEPAEFLEFGQSMRMAYSRLAEAPWLSIAAVDGLALGGGLELALACTMRVASRAAVFGLPEVRLGLIPGAGGTQRLPRLVGRGRALDMMLTGRQIAADVAHHIGLVDRLTDQVALAEALRLARELSAASLPAQLAVVEAVDLAYDGAMTEGLAHEADIEARLFADGDAAEGLSAFVAKRNPNYDGTTTVVDTPPPLQ